MLAKYGKDTVITLNKMEILVLILAFLGGCYGADFTPGTRVKFGTGANRGVDYYIKVPQNVTDAKDMSWIQTARPAGHMPSLTMYCAPELEICVLYDDTEFIAGTQIAVSKDRVSNTTFDWETQGYVTWTVNGSSYWAIAQYFVDEGFLSTPAETRIASRNSSWTVQTDAIWVTGFNGQLLRLPVDLAEIGDTEFDKQACIAGMATHYYYNVTNQVCASDLVLSWYGLYDNNQLIGTQWVQFGQYSSIEGQTQWFEIGARAGAEASYPDAAECVLTLAEHTLGIHTHFVDNPWDIACQ